MDIPNPMAQKPKFIPGVTPLTSSQNMDESVELRRTINQLIEYVTELHNRIDALENP